MPFTLAHPAAVLPLAPVMSRWLGSRGVLSALVIGSMAPDIAFLLPFGISRGQSHSLAGLVWCCLPVGLASYLIYHWLLKAPLIDLLPHAGFARLHRYASGSDAVAWKLLPVTLICLEVGAVTHLVWDSFTHRNSYVVSVLPLLRTHLYTGGGFWIYLYTALQWICSVVGLVILAWAARRWIDATPQPADAPRSPLGVQQQRLVVAFLLVTPTVMGAMAVYPHLHSVHHLSMQELVSVTLLSWLSGLGLALVVYAALWRILRR